MATIKYTSIINSFVSQEGCAGSYTNYIYYSVLVKYVDGTSEVVEGKLRDIKPLLFFLRTPQDEIEKLRTDMNRLRSALEKSDQTIVRSLDEKLAYVIDSVCPIPDIIGMKESEGLQKLTDAGLSPVITNDSNRSVMDNRIISSVKRSTENFRIVKVTLSYQLPTVVGMNVMDALETVQKAGFVPTIKYTLKMDMEDGIVLSCSRNSDTSCDVELEVSKAINISSTTDEDNALPNRSALSCTDEMGKSPENDMVVSQNNINTIKSSALDEEVSSIIIHDLKYITILASPITARRKLEDLYRRTHSKIIKYILEQPDDKLKETGTQILAELEKRTSDTI